MPQHYTSFEQCMRERTNNGMSPQDARRECALHFARKAGVTKAFGKLLDQLPTGDIMLIATNPAGAIAQSEEFERCVEQHKSDGMTKDQAISACQRAFERARNR